MDHLVGRRIGVRLCDCFDGFVPGSLEVSCSFRYYCRELRSAYCVDSPLGEVSTRLEDTVWMLGYFN